MKIAKQALKQMKLDISIIVLYEVLFIASAAVLTYFWFAAFQRKVGQLGNIYLPDLSSSAINNLDPALLDQSIRQMTGSLYFFYLSILFLLLSILIIWSFFKGLIWARTSKIKFTFGFFYKFLLLNLMSSIIWSIPLAFIFLLFKAETVHYVITGILFIIAYFTSISYALFLKHQKATVLFQALYLGISEIRYFSVAFLTIGILFFVLLLVFRIFSFLPSYIYTIFASVLFFLFLAWIRYYIIDVVDVIES